MAIPETITRAIRNINCKLHLRFHLNLVFSGERKYENQVIAHTLGSNCLDMRSGLSRLHRSSHHSSPDHMSS